MKRKILIIVGGLVLGALSACSPSAGELAATYVAETATAAAAAGTSLVAEAEETSMAPATSTATATTAPSLTPAPSATPRAPVAIDMLTALDEGLVSIDVTNGDRGSSSTLEIWIINTTDGGQSVQGSLIRGADFVEIRIRNNSDAPLLINLQAGILLGDEDPLTVDLVLPAAAGVEIPPGSEVSRSMTTYQAAFQLPDPGDEVDGRDFFNSFPMPATPLTILGVDDQLATVLEAAGEGAQAGFDRSAQLAVLATASDIWAREVAFCNDFIVSPGAIRQGDKFFYLICPLEMAIGFGDTEEVTTLGFSPPPGRGSRDKVYEAHVEEAREILRIAGGLNEKLAAPFRVAIQSGNGDLAEEELQAALVALVDQSRMEEAYGFGVTFHRVTAGPISDAGLASLPEITDAGMSPAEAQEVVQAWIAANGSFEFKVHLHSGHYMIVLAELLTFNWYDAGVSPEMVVHEFETLAFRFFSGKLEGFAVEHRPGLLP